MQFRKRDHFQSLNKDVCLFVHEMIPIPTDTRAGIIHYLRRVPLPINASFPPTPFTPTPHHLDTLSIPLLDKTPAPFPTPPAPPHPQTPTRHRHPLGPPPLPRATRPLGRSSLSSPPRHPLTWPPPPPPPPPPASPAGSTAPPVPPATRACQIPFATSSNAF